VKDSVSQAGISSTFSEAQVAGMFPARELKMNPPGVAMTSSYSQEKGGAKESPATTLSLLKFQRWKPPPPPPP
jgi:hypothetical protein